MNYCYLKLLFDNDLLCRLFLSLISCLYVIFTIFKRIGQLFGKYIYLLFRRKLDERIDTSVMSG